MPPSQPPPHHLLDLIKTMNLKNSCRICLFNNSNIINDVQNESIEACNYNDNICHGYLFDDDQIHVTDEKLHSNNVVNNNNEKKRMFSIHKTMISKYFVRELISNVTKIEVRIFLSETNQA